jgi:glutamate carboxypeptidase
MIPTTLSSDLAGQIETRLHARQMDIVALIRALVEIESPSGYEAGSKAVVALLAEEAGKLSCVNSVERADVAGFGQHLVIRAFQGPGQTNNVLLVGHTDTVHSLGSLRERPWRREENRIYGPGIFDMKANCALAIEALRVCDELKIVPRSSITIALTCDEEVGSSSGWPLLETIARAQNTRYALVLEPPASEGRVKTGRKGTGIFSISVEGKAAHAGLDPDKGASAILELARQTERIHAMNQLGSGITVNVGVISGGTRSNVVAAEASGEIDVRFSTAEEAKSVEDMLFNLYPFDERVKVVVTGGINRPPMERTEQVIQLFERARDIAAVFNFELGEAQVGGASDGNFLAALGIPVLDGLGIRGDGAHATHEHIEADDIPRRGALLAGLLATI